MTETDKPVWTLMQVGHFGQLYAKEFENKEALLDYCKKFENMDTLYVACPGGQVKPISWQESYKEEMIPVRRFTGITPSIK